MTFWKLWRQYKDQWFPGTSREGGMHRQSEEELESTETYLCGTVMVDTGHYTFVQTCRMNGWTPRVTPNENNGPWVVMRCLSMFINCNKWTTLVWNVDRGGCWERTGGIWEISCSFCSVLLWMQNCSKNKVCWKILVGNYFELKQVKTQHTKICGVQLKNA